MELLSGPHWRHGRGTRTPRTTVDECPEKGRNKATWKREFKVLWREAGPLNHLDDKVDSDQEVVDKELSL